MREKRPTHLAGLATAAELCEKMAKRPSRRHAAARAGSEAGPGHRAGPRSAKPKPDVLNLRFLGEIEVRRGDRLLALPQSKKTRALLAYLVVSARPRRRERLCSLLWDVTDDPRAALRWSLSKLRPIVDEPERPRIVTDGDTVGFDADGVAVDTLRVRRALADGVDNLSRPALEELAREFRGEFLEGLELADFHEFQLWCLAEREELRRLHAAVRRGLIDRLTDAPEEALAHARALAQADPLDEAACATLVRLLARTGRSREAEEYHRAAVRMLEELGSAPSDLLLEAQPASRERVSSRPAPAAPSTPPPVPELDEAKETAPAADVRAPIGRTAERSRLAAAVDQVRRERRQRIVLLTGEPGIGKSRLLEELIDGACTGGGTVLTGCAYEAESGRPYGPWVDALQRLPATSFGPTIGADLAPLFPGQSPASEAAWSRDRLFGAVVELVAARAHSAPPVLLVFDDVQWCDEASTMLLHYVARMNRHRAVLIALAARAGEFLDNVPLCRALRALRRDSPLVEIPLATLSREETAELIEASGLAVDADRVFAESGGNPLYALEVARALPHRRDALPPTLKEVVRERLERLPAEAADVLRWSAVLGQTFRAGRLARLVSIGSEALVAALETLERRALLRSVDDADEARDAYSFAHNIVRNVVYGDVSLPRRRLMHARVAEALGDVGEPDEVAAAEIARHAALAGEAATAARACVTAGRRCLRLFATAEAEALARRGMHHAAKLREPERVRLLLELTQIAVAARRPARLDEEAQRIEALAEEALAFGCLEHARLGFHMISYLRWEEGAWSDAQRHMLRAEFVSRSADAAERVVAMAEAARCLALVERDLGQGEELLLEARGLAKQLGIEPVAVADGLGILRMHQGRLEEAAELFERAQILACRDGNHDDEFQALAHRCMLELDAGRYESVRAHAAELSPIADKLRGGSEAPFAKALAALSQYALGDGDAGALDQAVEELRVADAKHRLAFVLTRAAQIDVRRARLPLAQRRAEEALRLAQVLESPSDVVLARVLLAHCATALEDAGARRHQLDELDAAPAVLSAHARLALESLLDRRNTPRALRRPRRAS
jgi:DNA-binding SARP family transcriptional activator